MAEDSGARRTARGRWRRLLTGRRGPAVLAVAAAAAVVAAGCLGFARWSPAAPSPPPVTASGSVEADETLIAPQVTALITSLPLAEGDDVAAGQVVATLDDSLLQVQMQSANMETLRQLQLQDRYYTLRSPLTGIVTREPARVGETALPGEVLLAVADLSRLQLTLYVSEADLARVFVGQRLQLTADPYPGSAFSGQVTSIASQAEFTPRDIETRADRLNLVFAVKATVPNPTGVLKPGMYVEATFLGSGPVPRAAGPAAATPGAGSAAAANTAAANTAAANPAAVSPPVGSPAVGAASASPAGVSHASPGPAAAASPAASASPFAPGAPRAGEGGAR